MKTSDSTEQQLRQQVEELERQLRERDRTGAHANAAGIPTQEKIWRPSAITISALFLGVAVVLVIAFLTGYMPLQKRQTLIAAEAVQQEQALPRVEVVQARRSSGQNQLELPGSIQAITE
ncbi:MAG TPA: hypothetical protein VGG00_05435, partial [Rhodanobacter sp.]